MENGTQVKSKKRVADHGEVFTAEREVNAMLDLVNLSVLPVAVKRETFAQEDTK